EDELATLYARCLAVYYAPVDEDFGMVPYEAFLSEKPVVTTTDAGGPLEVVADRTTGLVCAPQADDLARACSWLRAHVGEALRRHERVVVLHDFVLHHLVAGLTLGRRDGPGYLAALERDAGIPGRLLSHGVLEGRVAPLWETRPDEFPLAGDVLRDATG